MCASAKSTYFRGTLHKRGFSKEIQMSLKGPGEGGALLRYGSLFSNYFFKIKALIHYLIIPLSLVARNM